MKPPNISDTFFTEVSNVPSRLLLKHRIKQYARERNPLKCTNAEKIKLFHPEFCMHYSAFFLFCPKITDKRAEIQIKHVLICLVEREKLGAGRAMSEKKKIW